jgi:hypothetical protein
VKKPPERLRDLRTQAELLGHPRCRQTVRRETLPDPLAPGDHQDRRRTQPVEHRLSMTGMAQHETEGREARELDLVAVASEGDVIAEPPGHLGRIRHAPHPREQRHEVHVLHGLPQPQVRGQGERSQEARPARPGVALRAVHGCSLRDARRTLGRRPAGTDRTPGHCPGRRGWSVGRGGFPPERPHVNSHENAV